MEITCHGSYCFRQFYIFNRDTLLLRHHIISYCPVRWSYIVVSYNRNKHERPPGLAYVLVHLPVSSVLYGGGFAYSMLNDYRHKLGQCESGLCECGQMETVQHYLLQCQLYEEERNILYNSITDFENSWVFTHQMSTPYLGMTDIGKYQPGENR